YCATRIDEEACSVTEPSGALKCSSPEAFVFDWPELDCMPLVAGDTCLPQAQTAKETTKTMAAIVRALFSVLSLLMITFSLSLFQYATLQQLQPATRMTLVRKAKFHFGHPQHNA